jgi:hypothetical protein
MTDPERFSKRGVGLAGQLLRAGADEQPSDVAVARTLAALGLSGAVLTSTSVASATAGTKLAGALSTAATASGAANAVTATLLAKWIGIGVIGGIGLAGAAAVATRPSAPVAVASVAKPAQPAGPRAIATAAPGPAPVAPPVAIDDSSAADRSAAPAPAPRTSMNEPANSAPELDVGAPLAAEVQYVDRARALLGAGQTALGLSSLERYEREFPEARLLPEVLFLKLEAYERLGRANEARGAAQRLVGGFPKSPHSTRARKLLEN